MFFPHNCIAYVLIPYSSTHEWYTIGQSAKPDPAITHTYPECNPLCCIPNPTQGFIRKTAIDIIQALCK